MRRLAKQVQDSHGDLTVHQHLRDAARVLESGNEEGAQRHLRAAAFALSPQSLMRNGLHTDDHHQAARSVMHGVHRHLLLVKDITDAAEKNQRALARDSYGDDSTSNPVPKPPVQADPNAGYGPGALAQKPTARQPPGNQALNAPNRTNSGGSDPAVADPVGPQPRGSKQFAYGWGDLTAVIEMATRPKVINLVGPAGYIHGWIYVGVPAVGAEVYHPGHGRGTVTSSEAGRVQVAFDAGHSKSFPVRSHQGPGHFEQMTDDELAAEYQHSAGSRADAALAEADRRDRRDQDAKEQAKAQRVSALYAEHPKTEADRSRVYQGLVNEGENPEDAWAHAHDTNPEAMQKQAVMQQLAAQGYKGSGFDALTRAAYKDDIRRRQVSAEGATNGYKLSPAGKKAGIDPYSLFTGPESRARKYASPELKEWWDQNGRPTAADFQAQLMGRKAGMKPADFYASVTWDDVAAVIELSAQTAALESTPAPRGKPGGPGLYHVAGNEHSPYLQQIVKALIEKRGMPPAKAYAIAWGALRKWSHEGGKVHPEVSAAAGKALGQEAAASAKAHAHAVTWEDHLRAVELATVLEFFNPAQTRVAAGSATGGQFAPAGASGQQSQQQGKGKQPAKPDAHQQHLAHLAHLAHLKAEGKTAPAANSKAGGNAQKKAALLKQAAGYRTQADALIKQRDTLRAELASASGKTSTGQSGSTTSAGASTTSSTAPKAAANAAPGTAAASASTTPSSSSTSSTSSTSSGTSTSSTSVNTAQVKAQIAQLNTQITGLQAQYKQAVAAAAKL